MAAVYTPVRLFVAPHSRVRVLFVLCSDVGRVDG